MAVITQFKLHFRHMHRLLFLTFVIRHLSSNMTAATQAARPVNTGSRVQVEPSEPQASTSTNGNGSSTAPVGVLKLRGTPKRRQRVMWSEGTIDNEGMGKKSSKSESRIKVMFVDALRQSAVSITSPRHSTNRPRNLPPTPLPIRITRVIRLRGARKSPLTIQARIGNLGEVHRRTSRRTRLKGRVERGMFFRSCWANHPDHPHSPTRRAAKHKHRHAGHRHPHDENCSDKPAPKANKYDMPSKKAETKPGVLPTSR